MTKTEYAAYLASDHWQTLRKDRISESPACERCNLPRWLASIVYDQDLHLHHKTYKNLGDEMQEDLEVLCRRCHDKETFGRSDLKAPKSSACEICRSLHWDPYSPWCADCLLLHGVHKYLGRYWALPRWGEVDQPALWKMILASICSHLACGDSGSAAVVRELAEIDSQFQERCERHREALAFIRASKK